MVRKHPDVKEKGSKIDLSDLHNDPVVMFQHRHYLPLALTLCIVIPTLIPVRIRLLNLDFASISHTLSMLCEDTYTELHPVGQRFCGKFVGSCTSVT